MPGVYDLFDRPFTWSGYVSFGMSVAGIPREYSAPHLDRFDGIHYIDRVRFYRGKL